jgi:hypothetical protein
MKFIMGVDPDLHCCGFGIYNIDTNSLYHKGVIQIPKKAKGLSAVVEMSTKLIEFFDQEIWKHITINDECLVLAVEGQQIYPGKGRARPNDLLKLAHITGSIISAAIPGLIPEKLWIPSPREWKGNVPKPVHQARTCEALGWGYKKTQGYAYPTGTPGLGMAPAQWKQALDGIGLALWAFKKWSRRNSNL